MKNFLNHLMTSTVLLVSLGASVGTDLEAQTMNLHAVVPFAWQINGHQLNAGDYQITKDSSSPVVAMRDIKNGKGTFMQVSQGTAHNSACKLIFHRYGDQYFLAAIVGTDGVTNNVPFSNAERVVRSEQPREMAIVFVKIKPLFD
jgi:hypothetical protein